jgi:hypothetical protein
MRAEEQVTMHPGHYTNSRLWHHGMAEIQMSSQSVNGERNSNY